MKVTLFEKPIVTAADYQEALSRLATSLNAAKATMISVLEKNETADLVDAIGRVDEVIGMVNAELDQLGARPEKGASANVRPAGLGSSSQNDEGSK